MGEVNDWTSRAARRLRRVLTDDSCIESRAVARFFAYTLSRRDTPHPDTPKGPTDCPCCRAQKALTWAQNEVRFPRVAEEIPRG